MPQTDAKETLVRRDVQVEPRRVDVLALFVAKLDADVGLVGSFVPAEAGIALHAHQGALESCETEQSDARTEVAAEQTALDGELASARSKRDAKARQVPLPLLGKYDKIRIRRRSQAAWPVKGTACGACDTAIPMQRRNQMSNHGGIDVCEACGVLMYFAE